MIEYPKIETLYDRDTSTFKVNPEKIRMPEFEIIKKWHVTEKIDGTNVRVAWLIEEKRLVFGGRTDNAQMPVQLISYLQDTFKPEMFMDFDADVTLFGEGYGEKIQKGGGNYRRGVSFRLFDVLIGKWWLEPDSIANVADRIGICTAPVLGVIESLPTTIVDLVNIVGEHSRTAMLDGGAGLRPEGIVARSMPLLFCRNGGRVMWKLKFKDFPDGNH